MASARDIALLRGADVEWQQSLTLLDDWDIPLFPIKGGDLITLGLNPGPLVAATLQQIERQWIAQGFPDTAATLLLADQAVAEALSNKN